MDLVTSTGWEKNVLAKYFFLFLKWRYFSDIRSSLWKSALYYLIYLYIFLLYYNLYIYVYWALLYHYCVLNILQRIKTVNKIWWYKQLFFKLCFRAKYNLKPNIHITKFILLLFDFSSYSLFFFLFILQCFSSVFWKFFCTFPHNQENHDFK